MQLYKGLLRSYVLSSILAITLAVPAVAQPGHSDVLSTIRIANFGTVSSTYFRGGQPKANDFADLAALGVKTVIDLQKDGDLEEPGLVKAAGMQFVRIPMTTRIVPTPEQLTEFLKIVTDPARQPVYVHCAGGRHRTGVMTAVYRMAMEQWDAARAFAEMKKYHFGADYLHPEFKTFVFGYQPALNAAAPAKVLAGEARIGG